MLVLGLCLVFIAAIFTFIGAYHHLRNSRCTATAPGVLDAEYIEERHSDGLGPGFSDYELKYGFQVEGRLYRGSDRVDDLPKSRNVIVYFNPSDPEDSLIEPQPFKPWYVLMTVALWVAGGLIFAREVLAFKKRAGL